MTIDNQNSNPVLTSPIRVMVVDDSVLITRMIASFLNSSSGVEVVAIAHNGLEAIEKLKEHKEKGQEIDVITLDVRMPEMDGLVAVRHLLLHSPDVKILMVSSITGPGSKETFKALALGASDCIEKPTPEHKDEFDKKLLESVLLLGNARRTNKANIKEEGAIDMPVKNNASVMEEDISLLAHNKNVPDIIVIGSSTGGPNALTLLFTALAKRRFTVPVLVVQHMPANFTSLLAHQLERVSGTKSFEGRDGQILEPGCIYVAPGDHHMIVDKKGDDIVIATNKNPAENFCRPSVDPTLRSVAEIFGNKSLVLIMTGMGSDGLLGSKEIVAKGGTVIAQDKQTSIVWGMPGSVAKEGLCTKIAPLNELADELVEFSMGKIK